MDLRSSKTNRRLWFALSAVFFFGAGFVPLGHFGKWGDETLRIIPALVQGFHSEPLSSSELAELAVFILFWLAAAVSLGWLAQCAVVLLLPRKREKADAPH